MKVTIEIDISPKEARQMLGLPDLEPMQAAVIDKVQAKMETAIESMTDPKSLFDTFFPVGIQAMDQFQNFFAGIAGAASRESREEGEEDL